MTWVSEGLRETQFQSVLVLELSQGQEHHSEMGIAVQDPLEQLSLSHVGVVCGPQCLTLLSDHAPSLEQ